MAKSAKERMKKYRANMTDEKCSLAISKNAAQQRRSREKWDEKKKQQQNASAKLRMQKMRARRKEAATQVNNLSTPSKSFPSGFSSESGESYEMRGERSAWESAKAGLHREETSQKVWPNC